MRDQRHGRLVEAEGAIAIMASTVFAFDLFAVLPLLPQTPVGRGAEAVLLVPLFFTVRSWLIATLIIPIGAVLDKFGPRLLVPAACIVKAGGFWLASSATDELGFLAAAAALGLGTAVTRPAMKSIIAAIRQRSPGSQLFAGQNIATNVAAIGGPAAAQAAVLMGMSEQMFLLLIALEVGMAVALLFAVRLQQLPRRGNALTFAAIRAALLPWLLPVYANQVLAGCAMTVALSFVLVMDGADGGVADIQGTALAFQAICLIAFQSLVMKVRKVDFERYDGLAVGVSIIAALWIGMDGAWGLFLGLAVLAAAEAIIFPALHNKIADRLPESNSTAYAVLSLAQTFGEILGGACAAVMVLRSADSLQEHSPFLLVGGGLLAVTAAVAWFDSRLAVSRDKVQG